MSGVRTYIIARAVLYQHLVRSLHASRAAV